MVRITEDLVRKRAEHNECEISTLEEVSLHQQDIEKIEHIDKWCRELKILYLQSNLIPKIENVSKLKKLEYLNLALNNVEKVENLEGCESLKKLDLTVNFIGELTSIDSLKGLYNLRTLYLTGNPCTEYEGYREYVIATLPQLQTLDGVDIDKSERILALQEYGVIKARLVQQQKDYRRKREREKEEAKQRKDEKKKKKKKESKPGFDGKWYTDINEGDGDGKVEEEEEEDEDEESEDEDAKVKAFWEEKTDYTPESRIEVHEHMKDLKKKEEQKELEKNPPPKPRRLFNEDGRPFNVNEPKIDFTLQDDEKNNCLILDLACYKHLETSMIDVDVQPNYVKVVMKGKTFQLCLPEEVNADAGSAQRSKITGHLLVKMPKAKPVVKPSKEKEVPSKSEDKENKDTKKKQGPREEKLEVDEKARKTVDFGNIIKDNKEKTVPPLGSRVLLKKGVHERPNSEDFVDDPDVPPLM